MTTWTKRITEIGLLMLTEEARRERIAALMDGHNIDGSKVASLIDECAAAAGLYLEQNQGKVSAEDAELIKSHLKHINGKSAVAAMESNELAAWVLDLKESAS